MSNLVLQAAALLRANPFAGLADMVPAYCTLTVVYDAVKVKSSCSPGQTAAARVREYLTEILSTSAAQSLPVIGPLKRIPVCYEPAFAPDLEALCGALKLTAGAIVSLHTSIIYHVYMIGFMPGFPYMGVLPPALHVPRLAVPRKEVPAGSVGLAGAQTGIYPFAVPGGWQLIGRTPLRLFDAGRQQPCLLEPGDQVQFYPIDAAAFNQLKQAHR